MEVHHLGCHCLVGEVVCEGMMPLKQLGGVGNCGAAFDDRFIASEEVGSHSEGHAKVLKSLTQPCNLLNCRACSCKLGSVGGSFDDFLLLLGPYFQQRKLL